MAAVLPKAKEWTAYTQIDQLFDELNVPLFSRKGNLPRLLLIGILDYVESHQSTRFAALLRELPRGRADFFNLALGHVSKSYLLWTYMGMTITNDASTAAPSTIAAAAAAATSTTSQPTLQQLSALNDDDNVQQMSVQWVVDRRPQPLVFNYCVRFALLAHSHSSRCLVSHALLHCCRVNGKGLRSRVITFST
jgi:hypothetical protein